MENLSLAEYSHLVEDVTNQFSDNEVISLATTITGGLLKNKLNSRQDAIKAIISYSNDVSSILRRKLFTREKLLTYAYEKNITLKLPITKPEIIKVILKFWKSEINDENSQNYSDYSSDDFSVSTNDSVTLLNGTNQSVIKSYHTQEIEKEISLTNSSIFMLAEQFTKWFYDLWNENRLEPVHFFPDACLNIELISNESNSTNNISNDPIAITKCLLETKTQYDLFFNPNTSKEGLRVEMDPHGLVMIVIFGTLHSKSVCVGVFEQMFALARDPFSDNNWKIKRTDLKLKSSGSGSNEPTNLICGSDKNALEEK